MSAWAEVDQLRAYLASGTHATGEWRAFARTKTLRFRGREGDAGRVQNAAAEFLRWRTSAGKVLPGLVKRRAAERALFLEVPS